MTNSMIRLKGEYARARAGMRMDSFIMDAGTCIRDFCRGRGDYLRFNVACVCMYTVNCLGK